MQDYPVRRGHAKKTDLKALFAEHFGKVAEKDGWMTGAFGAMPKIHVKYEGLDKLVVDTETRRDADLTTAQQTIKAWNAFLEGATGYNAKQRGKKAQDAAKKGA
jgi:hypothetical protein